MGGLLQFGMNYQSQELLCLVVVFSDILLQYFAWNPKASETTMTAIRLEPQFSTFNAQKAKLLFIDRADESSTKQHWLCLIVPQIDLTRRPIPERAQWRIAVPTLLVTLPL
eukprot:2156597-Amphidinium_carterae.1